MSGAMNGKSSSQIKSTTAPPAFSLSQLGILQRKCDCGGVPGLTGQCEECSGKRLSGQRRGMNPTEPPDGVSQPEGRTQVNSREQPFDYSFSRIAVQPERQPMIQAKLADQPEDQHQVSQVENPTGMPRPLKAGLEALSGMDLSGVRVHHNSSKPAQFNALAYTQGQDIYVGQGQEKHLPHEGWHVVQQIQGRVKATMQAKGVSINDDSNLEQEADVMGTKALQMKGAEKATTNSAKYMSPALEMRSQLRTSSLSKPVIQRSVKTWGGKWDTNQYNLITPESPQGLRGVDIELKFQPGNNVNAELIGLTQSYRSIKSKNPYFINSDAFYKNRSIKSTDAITVDSNTAETDEGNMIDRLKNYNNPIYAVNSLASTSLDDTSRSPDWGQHGYHYTNSIGMPQHQDAILKDRPQLMMAEKESGQIFETTALATKGVQAGTYYGSVRWGWRTNDKGDFTKIPLSKVSDGVPSSTFMKSAKIWNASKSSTGADTVDLPLVDVKVTTAPVTLKPPIPMLDISLPIGTRVQIIQEWHPPLLNGTIKVIDGPHTGITGEVSYQEWRNIADERP